MIGKSGTGGSFRGLSGYLNSEEKVEWRETRALPGFAREQDIRLMEDLAETSRAEQPVYHLSVSYAPGDDPTKRQMLEDADRLLEGLGLEGHQAVIIAHGDKDYTHMHLMVNRVHPEKARAWNPWRDKARCRDLMGQIEAARGYQPVPTANWGQQQGLTRGEYKQLQEKGIEQAPLKARAEFYGLDEMLRGAGSWDEAARELAEIGLEVRPKGRGGVIADKATGRTLKLSRVHRDHSFGKLQDRFGPFTEYRKAKEISRQLTAEVPNRDIGRTVARMVREGAAGKRISKGAKGQFRKAVKAAWNAEKSIAAIGRLAGGGPVPGPVKYALKAGKGIIKQAQSHERELGRSL